MILTVTLNPSIDVAYVMDKFSIDQANRVQSVRKTAGGKGLNVSRVIQQLNGNILATGFVGGYFGQFLIDRLSKDQVPHQFAAIKGETRSCIAILHEGLQTEVLENGPEISQQELSSFIKTYQQIIKEHPIKVITISGSLPKGLPLTFYSELIQIAKENKLQVLLDCSGQTLKTSLNAKFKPDFIKPNQQEISDLLNLSGELSTEQLTSALNDPLFSEIPTIMISLGSKGALIKAQNNFYQAIIPNEYGTRNRPSVRNFRPPNAELSSTECESNRPFR